MKLLLIILSLLLLLSGCSNNSKVDISKDDTLEIDSKVNDVINIQVDNFIVPNPIEWTVENRVDYRIFYSQCPDIEAFVFEFGYSGTLPNPDKAVFYSVNNSNKTEIAKLKESEAQVAYAVSNDNGLYWTTADYNVYCYKYKEKIISKLPIKCMTTFSLSNDYLFFLDASNEKLSYINLKNEKVKSLDNQELLNPFAMPLINNETVLLCHENKDSIVLDFFNLKSNRIVKVSEIKDNRIKNVVKTRLNNKWIILTCLPNSYSYADISTYIMNRDTGSIRKIDVNSDTEIFTENSLVYLEDGVVNTYDLVNNIKSKINEVDETECYRISKAVDGSIILHCTDQKNVNIISDKLIKICGMP